MSIKDKRIAIVGGGPGGLTLARLLQNKGADVKVYERDFDKHVRVQGATLDLHEESGLAALEEAGLMGAFNDNYRPGADKLCLADKDANIVWDEKGSEDGGAFRPEIDRGPLRQILLESLKPDTVVWDSHFLSIEKVDGSWKLSFNNGSSATADLVIAADGANSKLRPLITPIKPFYSGVTVVEGSVYDAAMVIPEICEMVGEGKIFAFGDEKSLIVSTKGDGSIVFYIGFKTDEDWSKNNGINFADKSEVLSWFKKEYDSWNPIWSALFENVSASFILRPQYCMPLDQTWESLPDLTMLGDAAHLMPPYAGEGVNMAMLDALELSNCLTSDQFTDVHQAITAYETQMRKRATEVMGITLEQTEALHSPHAITHMLSMFS